MTIEELEKLLAYDPITGFITWKVDRSNQMRAGMRAGSVNHQGYLYIEINSVSYRSARIAWALHYKEWPRFIVDHKDQCKMHDWITNLRLASKRENNHNQGLRRDNKVGRKGVTYDARIGRYRATIKGPAKQIHIGMFATANEAGDAYDKKARELFGEFAK